ncbi:MAG: SRPBCC family protein [Gelidibacter sp.]
MKLDSSKQPIDKSSQEVHAFLNDVKNFEKLMPENISKFEMVGNDGFVFALSGMPEVALQKKVSMPPNKLILEAAGGKLDFNLTIDISEVTENSSEAQFIFTGDFNAMIGMMVKGPISKLIETWVSNIPKAINTKG